MFRRCCHPLMHPAVRKAAAVIALTDDGQHATRRPTTILVKRRMRSAFVPGTYVFPGGAMEEGDSRAPTTALNTKPDDALLAFRNAALRELHEEAGICIADHDRLVPFAHWLTPEGETRRFDTWFFLVRLHQTELRANMDAEMRHLLTIDTNELDGSVLVSCEEALRRNSDVDDTGFYLPLTTAMILDHLASFASCDEVFSWANANEEAERSLLPICPVNVPGTAERNRAWRVPRRASPHFCGGRRTFSVPTFIYGPTDEKTAVGSAPLIDMDVVYE